MTNMSDSPRKEPELVHQLRNHLAIVISFADLLLLEIPDDDAHRSDILEIHKAAYAAMGLMSALGQLHEES